MIEIIINLELFCIDFIDEISLSLRKVFFVLLRFSTHYYNLNDKMKLSYLLYNFIFLCPLSKEENAQQYIPSTCAAEEP